MNREEIIQFIRANDPFYRFVNFDGHSDEELLKVKQRIEEKNPKNGTKKPL